MIVTTRPRPGQQTPNGATLDLDFARRRGSILGVPVQPDQFVTEQRSTSALVRGAGGVYATVQSYMPRFERTYDGRPNGLRIDPADINTILYSCDFTQSAWVKGTGASQVVSSDYGPDNTTPSSLLTDSQSIGSSPASWSQTLAINNDSNNHQFDIFIKPGTITKFGLTMIFSGGTGITAWAQFDLALGVVWNNSSNCNAFLAQEANGYIRCAIACSNNSTGNTSLALGVQRMLNTTPPGNFYVWGAHHQGSYGFMTPSLSGASSGSRNADNPAILMAGAPWYNNLGGSFFVDVYIDGGTTDNWIMALRNVSYDKLYLARANSSSAISFSSIVGGATQMSLSCGNAVGQGARYRAAFRYANSNFAIAIKVDNYSYTSSQDAGIVLATSGAILSTPVYLDLGSLGGAAPMQGTISRLTYFPELLSNQDLADLIA